MIKHIFFSIILVLNVCIKLSAQLVPEADELLEELVTKKGNIGVAAAYSVGGEIRWINTSGYACKEEMVPFTESTQTRIASIIKSMTAVAIMQLVEKGLIDLDKPVQVYLPDFPKKEKGEITTRQLLSHTSGVSQYQDKSEVQNKLFYPSLKDAITVFQHRPLLFEPGSQFFYTSYGYVILGRIIESVSGMSYRQFMSKNIFDKAGMTKTEIEKLGVEYPYKSCLYHKGKNKAKKAKANDLSNRIPGGGYQSTLTDIIKFGEALLEGKYFSDETFRMMLESQPVEFKGNKYGLGWYFYGPAPNENVVIGHEGGQIGCTGQLMIIPKTKTVVVVLSNTSGTYRDIATFAGSLVRISETNR